MKNKFSNINRTCQEYKKEIIYLFNLKRNIFNERFLNIKNIKPELRTGQKLFENLLIQFQIKIDENIKLTQNLKRKINKN